MNVMRSGILVGLLVATGMMSLAYAGKGNVATKYPEPEDATVKNGVFQDDYFGIPLSASVWLGGGFERAGAFGVGILLAGGAEA